MHLSEIMSLSDTDPWEKVGSSTRHSSKEFKLSMSGDCSLSFQGVPAIKILML